MNSIEIIVNEIASLLNSNYVKNIFSKFVNKQINKETMLNDIVENFEMVNSYCGFSNVDLEERNNTFNRLVNNLKEGV
jgi:hypothetical protein